MFTRIILPLTAVALLVFAVVHVAGGQKAAPEVGPPVEPAKNPYTIPLAGSGMIEAQSENIAIGSPVPGIVVEVAVQVNQRVEAGEVLFRLDDRALQAELKLKQSAVAAAQASLNRLENQPRPEELQMAEARLAEAESNLVNLEDKLKRTEKLIERNVATQEELVTDRQARNVAQAQLERAKAEKLMTERGAWDYDKLVARASVSEAKAAVQQVETELDRLVVRALVAGEILQVDVRPGEYVAAPSTNPLIILGNVQVLHVRVDIDEYDIYRFDRTAPASAALKGQPDQTYPLNFVRIEPFVRPKRSLTGDNTERVDTRVLQVIYALPANTQDLYVGQQLDVFIDASKKVTTTGEIKQQ